MRAIFLSYAREDKERARLLASALEARHWVVWWDRRIPHGKDFNAYIQEQLDSAGCILVLWSKAALASQFVRDEATEGLNDGRLVPALLDAVKQPLGFRQLQAADLSDWHGQSSHDEFDRLVDSIEAIVPRPPAASAVEPPATSVAAEPALAALTPIQTEAVTSQSQPLAVSLHTEETWKMPPNTAEAHHVDRNERGSGIEERLMQWIDADPNRRIVR